MVSRHFCVIEESQVCADQEQAFIKSVEEMCVTLKGALDIFQDSSDPRSFVVVYYFPNRKSITDMRASEQWRSWRRGLSCILEGTPTVALVRSLSSNNAAFNKSVGSKLEEDKLESMEQIEKNNEEQFEDHARDATSQNSSPKSVMTAPHHPDPEFFLSYSETVVSKLSSNLIPFANMIRERYELYLRNIGHDATTDERQGSVLDANLLGDLIRDNYVLNNYMPKRLADGSVRLRERFNQVITSVSVTGEWIDWDDDRSLSFYRVDYVRSDDNSNGSYVDWECIVPNMPEGTLYKLKLTRSDMEGYHYKISPTSRLLRIHDDFVANSVLRTRSVADSIEPLRPSAGPTGHPRVYQVHVGMCTKEEKVSTFDDVRTEVLPHMVAAGFDVLLLMSVQEHTYYPHAGWHTDCPVALSNRFGSDDALAKLISCAHTLGIKVCVQFVLSHLASNGNSVAYIPGLTKGRHPEWDGASIDYSDRFAREYMMGAAQFWLREFKLDGFWFEGISSVLFKDQATNRFFDLYKFDTYFNHNSDLVGGAFLMELNTRLRQEKPELITFASDHVGVPGLSGPVSAGGLGFSYTATPHTRAALSQMQRDFYNWRFDAQALCFKLDRRTAEPRIAAVDSLASNMIAKRPMKIAFFAWETLHTIPVGGIAPHVTELAAALRRVGHEVHIFTRATSVAASIKIVHGVFYHEVPFQLDKDFVRECENMCSAFVSFLLGYESETGRAFDLCHGHDWLTARAVQAMAGLGRVAVFTMHSTESGRCGNKLFGGVSQRIRELEKAGCTAANRVICVSGVLADEVKDMYGVHGDKIRVTYNGINVQNFDGFEDAAPIKERLGIAPLDPTVLFVGRFVLQKGVDLLVEAAPAILRERGDLKFVIVGDGHMRSEVEARAQQLGVAGAFRFVGSKGGAELKSLFKMCDAVVVPSRNEPFGIVVLEAWSCYKPVIATTCGGPRDFVTPGSDGLLVDPNPDSIRWGVTEALRDFEKLRWMGEQGYQKARDSFSWDRIGTQTRDIYFELLNLTDAGYSYEPDSCGSLAHQWVGDDIKFHMGIFDEEGDSHCGLTLLRLATLLNATLASEASLTFQGCEFAHPDAVDFPRPGNHFKQPCRYMQLATRKDLLFKHHFCFVSELSRCLQELRTRIHGIEETRGEHDDHEDQIYVHRTHDNVVVFERGSALLVFNMNSDREFSGLTVEHSLPSDKLYTVLHTDQLLYAGWNRFPFVEFENHYVLDQDDGECNTPSTTGADQEDGGAKRTDEKRYITIPQLPSKFGLMLATKPVSVSEFQSADEFVDHYEATVRDVKRKIGDM
ncbi:glycosyltransferase family group 1 protein [Gregarina niphandrodes]|uniref:Glycosyltransferase family group 1 protein n=1 Tax=Gregarina niphandrodes TaxID=110365 RepID=A0A023BDF4_GRENI|nr:glycosyltransferase family group 1 protein [Gregarina niphandrodes]EZG88399.1 glycosyltransferase family group 1 protein [Gregarina niphandrodes]|eukprot:XP_011128573.1 glycosyltransferase family group 1 protein [Gregarina niphandrodes]